MASYKDVYTREIDALFAGLKRSPMRDPDQSRDRVAQEGPLGLLIPFGFNGSGVFDENDTLDWLIYAPDELVQIVKARVVVSFREFFAPATTVSSGGGSTSGSGSAHHHTIAQYVSPAAVGVERTYQVADPGTGDTVYAGLKTSAPVSLRTYGAEALHTHSTPAHSHDLAYGVYKETLPGSFSVRLRVYLWDGAAWGLVGTVASLTAEVNDVDLTDYITVPGKYRISLDSNAGQPNSGRLGCDAAGHILGAIQPR